MKSHFLSEFLLTALFFRKNKEKLNGFFVQGENNFSDRNGQNRKVIRTSLMRARTLT